MTAPVDQTPATGSVDVTGTAAPGAQIDVADVGTDQNSATSHATTTVGASGTFTVPVSLVNGTNVLVVTATAPDGGTAQAVRTVVQDVVDGQLIVRPHRSGRR